MSCRYHRVRLASLCFVLAAVAGPRALQAQAAPTATVQPKATTAPFSQVERIDHAALHVKNLQTSADFYKKVFGFDIVHKWNTTWMVGKGRIRLGLFQRPMAAAVDDPDKFLILEHVAFLTTKDGLARYTSMLDGLGIKHEDDDSGIAKSVFIRDPDGISIEVTYYYADAPPRR